jgi:hypothetical protein
VAFDIDRHAGALLEAFGVLVQDLAVFRPEIVTIEIEVDALQVTLGLVDALAVLAHLPLGAILIRLALALGNAAVVLALEPLIAVLVRFALPLALVILADHSGLATFVAIGINLALIYALVVLANGLFLGAITVLDTFDATVVLAAGALLRAIRILTALFALAVDAYQPVGVAFLGLAVIVVAALGKGRPAADGHQRYDKRYCRYPSKSLAERLHRFTLLAQLLVWRKVIN